MRTVLPKRSITELADQLRDRWLIREHTYIVYTLHPNAMILLQRSHLDLSLMTPLARRPARAVLTRPRPFVGTPPWGPAAPDPGSVVGGSGYWPSFWPS